MHAHFARASRKERRPQVMTSEFRLHDEIKALHAAEFSMFVSRMRTESSVLPCRGPLTQEDAQQGANQENCAEHSGITPLLGKAQHELITYYPMIRTTFLSVHNLLSSCRSSSHFMHANLQLVKICIRCALLASQAANLQTQQAARTRRVCLWH